MVASIASLKAAIIVGAAFTVGSWAATTYGLHTRQVTLRHLVRQVDEIRDAQRSVSETTGEILPLRILELESAAANLGGNTVSLGPKTPHAKAAPKAPSKTATLVITTPSDNSIVADDALASGNFSHSLPGDIWVFVWPQRAPGKGWPQSPDADKGAPATRNEEKGEWSTPISFGGPPQSYEIAVYVATPAASKKLSELLAGWAKRNSYPGMTIDSLPKGLVEHQRIKVTKR